jgi:hypothetical protein
MYTGNPHQDRNPWKSFTGGFRQGWGDRRRSLNKDANKAFTSGWKDGWQGPLGIQTAELTQKQKDFMGSPYNTPDFGVSKKELWDKTKGMEKKGFFGWGAQEPTTIQEFNDYYNQLEQGKAGNWLANYSPGAGYPNEDFYLQDPFRDIDPTSLIFPEGGADSDWDYNYRERRDDYDDRMYGPLWV